MKKSFLAATAVVLFQVNISALTLSEAVDEVVATNPEVLESVKDYNSLRSSYDQSYSGYRPSVDIEGEIGYEKIKNGSTNDQYKKSDIDSARIVLKQNLFEGFGTKNLIEKSNAKLNAAKFAYLDSVNKKAYDTILEYINLLKNQTINELSLENIEVHQKILLDIKHKIDSNVGKMSEYDRVAGRLAVANSKSLMKQNDLKEGIYNFHKLLGRFISLEDLVMPSFDEDSLPLNLQDALDKQISFHPQLKSEIYDLEAKQYDYEISKKEYYPKLDLELSRGFSNNLSGVDGREDDYKAVLQLKYNLYNGNYDQNEKQKMISNIHSQKEIENRIKRTLLNDLQLSWSGYQIIEKQLPALRKNKYFMKKTLKAYKEEYKLGKRKLINILDAENEYYNAQVQLVDAQYNLLLQKFKILKAQGTLYEDLKSFTFLDDYNTSKELTTKEDTLPLDLEVDKDKVLDEKDICVNSLKDSIVMPSGCDKKTTQQYLNLDLKQTKDNNLPKHIIAKKEDITKNSIEKDKETILKYVNFDEKSAELSNVSKQMMRWVLSKIKKVSSNTIIELYVKSKDYNSDEKNIILSTQRGYSLKRTFLMNMVDANGINIFPVKYDEDYDSKNYSHLKVLEDINLANLEYKKYEKNKILFEKRSSDLSNESKTELNKFVKKFKMMGDIQIDVVAYSKEYTNALKDDNISKKRAETITNYLKSNGLGNITIVPIGMGKYHEESIFDIGNENQKTNIVEFVVR